VNPTLRALYMQLRSLPRMARSSFGFDKFSGASVQFVVEPADWAIRRVGTKLRDRINETQLDKVEITTNPFAISNRVVHFGSQYMWESSAKHLARSNSFVTSFFHGKHADGAEVAAHIDRFLRTVDQLKKVVVSTSLVEQRLLDWGVSPLKLVRIPIGVDTTTFCIPRNEQRTHARRARGIPQESVVIGSFQKDGVGWSDGLIPKLIKGPDIFLNVVAKLQAMKLPVWVLLTGPARGYVKQGLETLGIPYTHEYPQCHSKLLDCYHALDVYLVTSREEGGPMALTESMATGVPVVSTRVGMAADLVVTGINGELVEVDDVDGLATGVMKLLNKPLTQCSRAIVRRSVLFADWSNVAEQHWQRVYVPLLKQHAE
jgi:glycosyltransferase involved in cell wall biosynthesis